MHHTNPRHQPATEPGAPLRDTLLEDMPEQGRPPRRSNPATRVKLFVAGAMAVLSVGYLIFSATQTSAVYYMTIPEMEALGPEAMNQQVRVGGMVVPGTIERDGTTLRFQVVDAEPETLPELALKSDRRLTVTYTGVVPDIFQDEIHVVVEGKLTSTGGFDARTLLAKCPSRFEAAPSQ